MLEPRSGTRLKARFVEAEPGVRAFVGFYDSMLEVSCSFVVAGDGERRCLPTQFTPSTFDFADAACETEVVTVQAPACVKPKYVFRWVNAPDNCTSRGRIFRVGAPIDRTYNNRIQLQDDGRCSKIAYTLVTGDEAYLLGDEVEPSTFVRARRVPAIPASSPLLMPMMLEAEDGAQTPSGWDVAAGTPCDVQRATDDTLRCIPEPTQDPSDYTFADDTCKTPLLFSWAGCPAQRYAFKYGFETCSNGVEIHAVGALASDLFQRGTGGACGAQAPDARYEYRSLGPVLPPSSFVALTESSGQAGTTIKRRLLTGPGTPPIGSGLFNVARNETCRVMNVGDNQWRCAPGAHTTSGGTYSDPACTQPLWAEFNDRCTYPGTVYQYTDTSTCPARITTWYDKGDPWTGPVFSVATSYDSRGNRTRQCRPSSASSSSQLFAVTAIPETNFPLLNQVEQ